jgi:hypothetical protein
MSDSIIFQKVTEKDMTEVMINEAAELFSSAYGVWGPEAKEKINKFCKEGNMTLSSSFSRKSRLIFFRLPCEDVRKQSQGAVSRERRA